MVIEKRGGGGCEGETIFKGEVGSQLRGYSEGVLEGVTEDISEL